MISLPYLLHMTNSRSPEADNLWQQALSIRYLVIDDIGKVAPSNHVMGKLFMLIDERYKRWQRKLVHTSFTSQNGLNSRPDGTGLENMLDPAIVDRIREMCLTVFLEGDSYRQSLGGR